LSHDIIPSDFFLFGWLKDEFASWSVDEISTLFEIVEEIPNTQSIETIARVFRTESKNWNKLLVWMMITFDFQHSKYKIIILSKYFIG
jgi:hypothetical protein